jgi:hypothetical protein
MICLALIGRDQIRMVWTNAGSLIPIFHSLFRA